MFSPINFYDLPEFLQDFVTKYWAIFAGSDQKAYEQALEVINLVNATGYPHPTEIRFLSVAQRFFLDLLQDHMMTQVFTAEYFAVDEVSP